MIANEPVKEQSQPGIDQGPVIREYQTRRISIDVVQFKIQDSARL
jgi:hypothetical protein